MLVIGGGATGAQVASIFSALGSRVELFEAGPRILATEDEDVSAVVAGAFRESGIVVHENFGKIDSFEKTSSHVRMIFSKGDSLKSAEAVLAVVAVGWSADTAKLNLPAAGVEIDRRGFVQVDAHLQTSAPHIFAAGDATGRMMLVPQAIQDGFVAATNAVRGSKMTAGSRANPIGSFTDPEYAQVGLTEKKARERYNAVTAVANFDSTTRTIIDGRTTGFCKLIVDRSTFKILGCHVVGERAVEITQVAAIAIAAGMRVDDLAQVPLSFPTYTAILGRVAASAARQLNLKTTWPANLAEEAA
jgi:dihydrolipoamide dehydrogenase